jgi:hypothetical protein
VVITFHVRNDRIDRDGMLCTLLDVLQEAGVIRNDSVRSFNGRVRLESAVVTEDPCVVVEIILGLFYARRAH